MAQSTPWALQIVRTNWPALSLFPIGFYTSGWTTAFNAERCRIGSAVSERERDPRCPMSRHKMTSDAIRAQTHIHTNSGYLSKRDVDISRRCTRVLLTKENYPLCRVCALNDAFSHTVGHRAGDGLWRLVKHREISAKSLVIPLKRRSRHDALFPNVHRSCRPFIPTRCFSISCTWLRWSMISIYQIARISFK